MDDAMEADPFRKFRFIVVKRQCPQIIVEANCGLRTALAGLKEDLAIQFGIPPAQQDWYHMNNIKLRNDKTLLDYGYENVDSEVQNEITVRST